MSSIRSSPRGLYTSIEWSRRMWLVQYTKISYGLQQAFDYWRARRSCMNAADSQDGEGNGRVKKFETDKKGHNFSFVLRKFYTTVYICIPFPGGNGFLGSKTLERWVSGLNQ